MSNEFSADHKGLVADYIFCSFKYSLSFEDRVSMDLGYVHYSLDFYSKDLDILSDKELRKKMKALKKPWWYDLYEKYLEYNTKRLLICYSMLNIRYNNILQTLKNIHKIAKCNDFENKKRTIIPPEYLEELKKRNNH